MKGLFLRSETMTESSQSAASKPDLETATPAAEGFDFDQFLAEAEEKISVLKQRRQKVTSAQSRYESIQAKIKGDAVLESIEESQSVAADLNKIELEMVTELIEWVGEEHLSWKSPSESFWVFFRYAGIGFLAAIAIHYFQG